MPQRAAGGRSARAGPSFPPAPALLLLLASLTPAPATDGAGAPTLLAAPAAARNEAYAFHSHGRPWRHDEGLWRHFDWSAITTLCASSDLQDVDAPLLATAHSHGVRIAQLKGCYYREAGPATAGEAGVACPREVTNASSRAEWVAAVARNASRLGCAPAACLRPT